MLLVVTFRPEEPGPRPLFAALARLPHVTRLDLPPLSPAEVADQVRGILGDADAAAARNAHARGGGNPLFVEALVTSPGEAVPGSLRDLLLDRVRRLPGPARAAVRAASCAGDRAGHALLAAVTGLPDADLGEALRPAADHGLLIADGDGYAFRHALIREAVHGDLLPGERSALHRRYAEAVERRPELSDTPESALAVHWQACGDHARALAAAWRAAGERGAAAAHAERLTLLERVLDLWDRVPDAASLTGAARREVLEAAAEAAGAAGDPGRGLPLVRRALEETHRDREPGRAARLLVLRAQLRGQQGHEDELDDLREAARLVPGPLPARVEVLARLSSRLVVHGEMDEGERLAREGARLAAALGMGTARLWLETTAAAAAARDGDGDTAPLERLRGRGLGVSQTVNVLNTLTHCRLSTGHPAGGLAAADEALALAERAGLAHSLGPAPAVNRVEALYRLGRWDEAGAAPLARRIARRAGRAGLTGPSGGPLTARESEVLQLLARGRSNREIGRGAVHLAEDRQRPRLAHPRQARRLLPRRGRRRGPGPRPGVTGRPGARLGRRACEPPGAAHCRMASGGRCKRQGAAAGSGTRTRPGTVARTRGAFSARQTVVRRRAGRRRCARPRPPRRPRAPATPPRR